MASRTPVSTRGCSARHTLLVLHTSEEPVLVGSGGPTFPTLEHGGEETSQGLLVVLCLPNLVATELTASPNRPEGEMGASRRKVRSLSLMPVRLSHRCLLRGTLAAIERPMAQAVCLVARKMPHRQLTRLCSNLSAGQPGMPAKPP